MKQILKVLPTAKKYIFRTSAAWLLGGLSLWTTSIAYYSPVAKAQGFVCDGTFFLSQGETGGRPTVLYTVNTGSVPFNLNEQGRDPERNNGTGFRFVDSFIYAIDPDRPDSFTTPLPTSPTGHIVYKIDSSNDLVNGNAEPITGQITAGATDAAKDTRFIAGDIGIDNKYYVYGQSSPNTGGLGVLLQINVETGILEDEKTLNPALNIADFALNPLDGNFYAFSRDRPGQIIYFDPTQVSPNIQSMNINGLPTVNAPDNVGAAFFDGAGNLFLYQNSGSLYTVNVGVDGSGDGNTATRLSPAESVRDNDGSACPFAPKLEKSVSTNQVVAGGTIDYFYTITNPNAEAITRQSFPSLTFSDNLTNGRTFLSAEIIDDGSPQSVTGDRTTYSPGTVALSNNNQNLTVSGLGLPSTEATANPPQVGRVVIKATVQIAPNASAGTVFNQATLSGFTGSFPPSIPSDFPGAGALPDPSPLVILPPPTPAGTKSVSLAIDADNTSNVTPGDTIEYTVTYTNTNSSLSVTNFAATDNIDSNLDFVSGSYSFEALNGATVTANSTFNGTTDTNLVAPGGTLPSNAQVVIKYRGTVKAGVQPGVEIQNQAVATSTGGAGIITPSITDAVGDSAQIPQVLDDGQDTGNSAGNTGDDEPTSLVVADPSATGNLALVKRITNVIRNGVPLAGVNFSNFIDDPADIDDNLPGWSALASGLVGVTSLGTDNALTSGDIVEYTVYFLSNGREPVENLKICDAIPTGTEYVANSLDSSSAPATRTFFNELDSSLPVPPCPDSNNPNGSISLDLSPSFSNTNPNNVGFVKFRVQIE
ncbi:MAG: isopeptide-forming domain-containing fimbrial protein [Spirulinaceae cyanobacterium]